MRSAKSPARFQHSRDLVSSQVFKALRSQFTTILFLVFFFWFFFSAYGEYNDITLQVAGARNQTLVNWDFEYVFPKFAVFHYLTLFSCFFLVARETR